VNHGMRNIDKAIIGSVLGRDSPGVFSIAYNLILLPGMTICSLVGRVMFPDFRQFRMNSLVFDAPICAMARTVAFAPFLDSSVWVRTAKILSNDLQRSMGPNQYPYCDTNCRRFL